MNLHRLAVFRAVVETGGIVAAARQLVMSPAGVSMRLRALEEEVGVRLLQRRARRVVPTEAGEVLYAYAVQTLSGAQDVYRAFAEIQEGNRGRIAVGASIGTAALLMTQLLGAFVRQYPSVHCTITVDALERVRELVLQGQCDFGCVLSAGPVPGLVHEPLLRAEVILAVPPAHPLARVPRVTPPYILQHRFVTGLPGTVHRTIIAALLASSGVAGYAVAMELTDADSIRQATRDGVGIGIVIRSTVVTDLAQGALRELHWDHAPLLVQYELVYRRGHHWSPLLQQALSRLREACAPHLAGGLV